MPLFSCRLAYSFLCIVPFFTGGLVGMRPLRIEGLHQTIGFVLCTAIIAAAWAVGARAVRSHDDGERRLALAGGTLLAPFAIISLWWIGLGLPAEATLEENRMRYLVLLACSIVITGGFVVLKDSLHDAGERFYSGLGFAANMLSGGAYLVWLSFQTGAYVVRLRSGSLPTAIAALSEIIDILLFIACVMAYVTTAVFAVSLARVGWLGRGATGAYVVLSVVALVFLMIRGLSFPDPNAGSSPWHLQPGFIVGIPAVPWIMPFLLGVVLLRRAQCHGPACANGTA